MFSTLVHCSELGNSCILNLPIAFDKMYNDIKWSSQALKMLSSTLLEHFDTNLSYALVTTAQNNRRFCSCTCEILKCYTVSRNFSLASSTILALVTLETIVHTVAYTRQETDAGKIKVLALLALFFTFQQRSLSPPPFFLHHLHLPHSNLTQTLSSGSSLLYPSPTSNSNSINWFLSIIRTNPKPKFNISKPLLHHPNPNLPQGLTSVTNALPLIPPLHHLNPNPNPNPYTITSSPPSHKPNPDPNPKSQPHPSQWPHLRHPVTSLTFSPLENCVFRPFSGTPEN